MEGSRGGKCDEGHRRWCRKRNSGGMRWRGSKGHGLRAAEQWWWRRLWGEVTAASDWWIRALRAERVLVRSGFGVTVFNMLVLGFWGRKVNEWCPRDGGGGFMVSAGQ